MPQDKGTQRPRLRVNYVHIAEDPTATAGNQILALLQHADTLLRGLQDSPGFSSQPIQDFFSQPGRALWQPLIHRNSAPAEKDSDRPAAQSSSELKGLAKQVQAINSKLGALQAHLQKKPKSYADVYQKPPRTQHTCTAGPGPPADPVTLSAKSGGKMPLPPIPSTVRLSAVNRTAKGNYVLIGGPQIMAQQLTDALPYIKPVFEGAGYPVEAFTGTKWRCVCINGVPTPETGPAYTPGDIAEQLTTNNLWAKQLRMPIKPYWIRPPSAIEPGHRSTVVLTFEDEDGRAQQGVLRQRKAFLFGRSCTMHAWSDKKPTRKDGKATTPVNPAASSSNMAQGASGRQTARMDTS
ncbi:hypothetical protein F5887DRAFT_914715 [Amanita rubescens]|nr:hypothetical protein F5887DRAFT_914715 [Amanita rubescens]